VILINKHATNGPPGRLVRKKICGKISANVPGQTGGCLGPTLFYSRIFRYGAFCVPQQKSFPFLVFYFSVCGFELKRTVINIISQMEPESQHR